jgi:hypothetical protein
MSDLTLFDLDGPAWVPIYDVGMSFICRDCGSRNAWENGGSEEGGIFNLCRGCAAVDGCRPYLHEPQVERRPARGFTVDELASCSCGWFLLDRPWDGPISSDAVLDAIAEHITLTESSRWGMPHTAVQHEALMAEREKRRAMYLKKVAA